MSDAASAAGRPLETASDGYVSSRECRSCHAQAYESWHASFHRRMTQAVTPETVQSKIDGAVLTQHGKTWKLFREHDRFFVEMDEPQWEAAARSQQGAPRAGPPARVVRPIVMSTGSHHFEALWFSDEATRKVSLIPFCWKVDEQRWLPVDAAFLVPPREEQGAEGRWNISCNRCHATHPRPRVVGRYDMQTDAAEFGIACEACHGPGARHVAANRNPATRYAAHFRETGDATITNPERLDPVRASMICGQCHAAVEVKAPAQELAWNERGSSFRPGLDLTDERKLRTSGADKFWSDGTIRTSGREYNGLVHSPCYAHHDDARPMMTCFSCHEMHEHADDPRPAAEWADDQLKPGMRGDLACTQCHLDLASAAAQEKHTHHSAASAGSRCMDCHMSYVTYGLLGAIRSHTVASPTLAESLAVGRPNACNLCHLDRTLQWAGEKLAEWYGQPAPAAARGGHGLSSDEQKIAAGVLWITRGDAGQRALIACAMERPEVRATARSSWFTPFLEQLTKDPYAAVQQIAARCLRTLPPPDAAAPTAAGDERVLIDAAGRFDEAEFRRLLAQRDDRDVALSE